MKKGRVVLEFNKFYNVLSDGAVYQCELSGKLKHEAVTQSELPKVGDIVVIDEGDESTTIIVEICPRKNEFLRKSKGKSLEKDIIATNIDTAFIMMALNKDFNLHRLERYIILAEGFRIQPFLIFNKVDLCKDLDQKKESLSHLMAYYPHVFVSCETEEGVSVVRDVLKADHTFVVLGASGVGKSTLVNHLLGEESQVVGDIRSSDDRGLHTTRHRELFIHPSGAMIIDTPGIREVQIWESEDTLKYAFSDFNDYTDMCKFSNCSHSHEVGCAVKDAVESGKLPERRYYHYCKLLEEVKSLENQKKSNSKYLKRKKRKR